MLRPAEGTQLVAATDPAGNESRLEITVNDGHTWGDWSSNGCLLHTSQGGEFTTQAPKAVGSYTVRVTAAADDDYTSASAQRNFRITAKRVTIDGVTVEPSKTYDGTTDASIVTGGTLSANFDGNEDVYKRQRQGRFQGRPMRQPLHSHRRLRLRSGRRVLHQLQKCGRRVQASHYGKR